MGLPAGADDLISCRRITRESQSKPEPSGLRPSLPAPLLCGDTPPPGATPDGLPSVNRFVVVVVCNVVCSLQFIII